ncbi:site-specific integrase [Streptosporangiaceae bacterium NEAU-GS5]|nr:site-specific integrase [Streptosporangiaceae bacterium NEAU-GS5]
MSSHGSLYKRCGCRDRDTGKAAGTHCSSLSHPGHGSWYYSLEVPAGLDGRRRRIRRGGFSSRRAAAQALTRLRTPSTDDLCNPNLTVGRWLAIWLATRIALRPSTLRSYTELTHNHLLPALGTIPLRDLHPADIQTMFTRLARKRHAEGGTLSASSVARIHATLRAALNAAVRERLLTDNPARYVELPPARRPRAVIWTPDRIAEFNRDGVRPAVAVWTPTQTAHFLSTIRGHRLYAAYHLIALRGLRRSEAAGLRWCDVDLDGGVLMVCTQLQRVGGQVLQVPPKTDSSRRLIALDHTTVTALRRHRRNQEAELAERGREGHGWVFTHAHGSPINPDYLTRTFGALVVSAGLPPIRLHDLRHGAATLALQAGASLKVIQDQLGHSSIVLTADTYISVVPEVARHAAEDVARLVLHAGRTAPGTTRPRRSARPPRARRARTHRRLR